MITLDLALMVAEPNIAVSSRANQSVMDEIRRAKNILLFIDELHTIVGAARPRHNGRLKYHQTALSRRNAVHWRNDAQRIPQVHRKDAALERRFQAVREGAICR